MFIIRGRNINIVYPRGLRLFEQMNYSLTDTRNGPAMVIPEPVSTHYDRPQERVLFDAQRDANPFFHLVESLWMLNGLQDVATLAYYVPRMTQYSDDGITLHGAYGHRWRKHFPFDQLEVVIGMLNDDKTTRRAVLSMWDADNDLNVMSKDLPCNVMILFQVDAENALNMTVFNRSNDLIFGAYGANVVHLSMLHEYVWGHLTDSSIRMGWYEQVSANTHIYQTDWKKVELARFVPDPYENSTLDIVPLVADKDSFNDELSHVMLDLSIRHVVSHSARAYRSVFFSRVVIPMTDAYKMYRNDDVLSAVSSLDLAIAQYGPIDWLVAGRQWMVRRHDRRLNHG